MRVDLPRNGSRTTVPALAAVALGALPLCACGGDDRPASTTRTTAARPAPPVLDAVGIAAAFERLAGEMTDEERVFTLSLRPTEVVAEVARRANGRGRYLSLPVRGAKNVQPEKRVLGDGPGLRIDEIDRDGPRRLIEAAVRGRGPGATPDTPDDLALRPAERYSRRVTWQASFSSGTRNGVGWIGDAHGRHVFSTGDRAPAPAVGTEGPTPAPAGTNATSLLRAGNLRRALAALRRADPRGVLTYLDVEPDTVRADLRTGRRAVDYEVDPAFGVTPGGSNRAAPDELATPASTPDPRVPQRALRTIGRRLRADAAAHVDDVSYLPPESAGAPAFWFLATTVPGQGRQRWKVSADGSSVVRSSTGG